MNFSLKFYLTDPSVDPENMAFSLSMYIRETILTRWARQQISCFIAFCKKKL